MKKFVTFSTVLIVLALAVVLVFAQSGKTTESVNITNADNAKTVKIEFFYHGNNKTEQSFVVSHTLMLKKKYSQKLQITALDLDNAASIDGLLDQDMLFGTKNVICVLNKKFYLANMDIIADKITKYIDQHGNQTNLFVQ